MFHLYACDRTEQEWKAIEDGGLFTAVEIMSMLAHWRSREPTLCFKWVRA